MPSGAFDFSGIAAVLEDFGATLSDEVERPGVSATDLAAWEREEQVCLAGYTGCGARKRSNADKNAARTAYINSQRSEPR